MQLVGWLGVVLLGVVSVSWGQPVQVLSKLRVQLLWDAPAPQAGVVDLEYHLERQVNSAAWQENQVIPVPQLTTLDPWLSWGVTYCYRIRVVAQVMQPGLLPSGPMFSPYAATQPCVVPLPPGTPLGLSAVVQSGHGNRRSVLLRWQTLDALLQVSLVRNGTALATVPGTWYTDTQVRRRQRSCYQAAYALTNVLSAAVCLTVS